MRSYGPGFAGGAARATQTGDEFALLGIEDALFVHHPFVVSVAAQRVAAVFFAGFGFAEGQYVGHVRIVYRKRELRHILRCQPWRAKRRLVDPSSREAALLTRRAHSARGEAK